MTLLLQAISIASRQLRLVSSRLPRFLIATWAACANRCNSHGQRHFQPDVIVRHIEMTRRRLPERADAKDHAILLPSLLIDFQHRNAGSGARQSVLAGGGLPPRGQGDAESKRREVRTFCKSSADSNAM